MNSALRKLSSKGFLPGAPLCSAMGRLFGQLAKQSPVQSSEASPRAGALTRKDQRENSHTGSSLGAALKWPPDLPNPRP
jgi:hypothetical protein